MFISPTNEYPRFIGDIQLEHPDYVEGDALPTGWREVTVAAIPSLKVDETFEELAPAEVDGVLTQRFKVRKLTAEEAAFRNAPQTAKAKLLALGLTEVEIAALSRGLR